MNDATRSLIQALGEDRNPIREAAQLQELEDLYARKAALMEIGRQKATPDKHSKADQAFQMLTAALALGVRRPDA